MLTDCLSQPRFITKDVFKYWGVRDCDLGIQTPLQFRTWPLSENALPVFGKNIHSPWGRALFLHSISPPHPRQFPAINLLNAFSKSLQPFCSVSLWTVTFWTVLQSLRTGFQHQEESQPQSDASPRSQPWKHSCLAAWGGERDLQNLRTHSSLAKGQGSDFWLLARRKVLSTFSFQRGRGRVHASRPRSGFELEAQRMGMSR